MKPEIQSLRTDCTEFGTGRENNAAPSNDSRRAGIKLPEIE